MKNTNTIVISIFLEVFAKYAASMIYTHYLLLAMKLNKSKHDEKRIKAMKAHTQSKMSTLWDDFIKQNPALKTNKELTELKAHILNRLVSIDIKLNFIREIDGMLLVTEKLNETIRPMSLYFNTLHCLAEKMQLDTDENSQKTHAYHYLNEKNKQLAMKNLMYRQGVNASLDGTRLQIITNAYDTNSMQCLLYVSAVLILYASYDLFIASRTPYLDHVFLTATILANFIALYHANSQADKHIEAEVVFRYLNPDLKKKIKTLILTTVSSLTPQKQKQTKLKPVVYLAPRPARPPVTPDTKTNEHTLQSLYDGVSLSTKKYGKKSRETMRALPDNLASSSSVPATVISILKKPQQWDFNDNGEFKDIVLPNHALMYPLNLPGNTQYLFYDPRDMLDNHYANALQHLVQDGKIIPIYSKGENGIKVYSVEATKQKKEASAVIKVSDQRVYCRAVNARLSSGEACVIHIPVMTAKKNQYKAFVRRA